MQRYEKSLYPRYIFAIFNKKSPPTDGKWGMLWLK
nr:MAG TPA: hypothetical protein [Caudoviricetes sp.]